MQTDMLIFQNTETDFSGVAEKKKSIKELKTTSDLTEEESVFLSAFTGLLNEQINTVPAGLNSINPHNTEFAVKDNLNLIGGSKKITGELTGKSNNSESSDKIASVKNFESSNVNDSKSDILIAKSDDQAAGIAIKNNKSQMDAIGADTTEKASIKNIPNPSELLELKTGNQINSNLIGGSKKITGEFTEKSNNPESADKIASVKNFESSNVNDSKSDILIAKSDDQAAGIAIKNNKSQMDAIGADTTKKASIKNIHNASELLELKAGNQINSKETVLSEIQGSSEYKQSQSGQVQYGQVQSEAGIETGKKDFADHDQNIKKHNLIFFQKKEAPFTGFDKSFDDNSGSREKFNRKELFSKLEAKAPVQNESNKAALHTLEGGAVNSVSEPSPKINESVFTQIEDFKNKDSNINKGQIGAEKIESGHTFFKTHFSEQSAGTVKADLPVQKPVTAEVLPQIIDKALLTLRKGQNEIKISLKPESLGRIHLKIVTDNHHVLVKIIADNPHVKELIENNLHHLKSDLGNHGLAIDKFDVFMAGDYDKNSEKEGNNEFFKMKNSKYAGKNSGQETPDEPEAPDSLIEQDRGSNLVGIFA